MRHHRRFEARRRAVAVAMLACLAVTLATFASRGHADEPLASATTPSPYGEPPRSITYMSRTMGTYARIVVVTADSAAEAPLTRSAQAALTRVDSLMSNWTATSEVARLNRDASWGATPVEPEVAKVLEASLRTWRESDGAFDITVEPYVRLWGFLGGPKRVPTEEELASVAPRVGGWKVHFDPATQTVRYDNHGTKIDLGGIAKGYAVDVAAETLKVHGVANALVDVSGNMMALGHPPGAPAWRIGIRDPRDRVRQFARLPITGEAISTSGQYEQFIAADGKTYGHILDPRTGRPVDGLISVTIVGRTALDCDSWDTPLFVMGPEAARRKAKERDDIAAILVEPGTGGVDTVWVEESLRDRFTLEPEARTLFRVKYF
jgi:thiamine biosynthesis lipoprotein